MQDSSNGATGPKEKANGEEYIEEAIIGGEKLKEVSSLEMKGKLHRNIVSIIWKNSKLN